MPREDFGGFDTILGSVLDDVILGEEICLPPRGGRGGVILLFREGERIRDCEVGRLWTVLRSLDIPKVGEVGQRSLVSSLDVDCFRSVRFRFGSVIPVRRRPLTFTPFGMAREERRLRAVESGSSLLRSSSSSLNDKVWRKGVLLRPD